MPPYSAELQVLVGQLDQSYAKAWQVVVDEQTSVAAGMATNPRLWRRRDRLAEVRARIEYERAAVDDTARQWLSRSFPQFYAEAASDTAEALGSPFAWTQLHREAVLLHAQDLYDDLLEATAHVSLDTKRFLREVVREQVVKGQLIGETAVQTARNVTRFVQARGITAVRYANGRRVPLDTYAQMAVRTKTAVAYNAGTLNQGTEFGVKYYEVFDGPSCGWESHDDPRIANGRLVTAGQASNFMISHPQCRRSFGARPDVNTAAEARKLGPTEGGQPDIRTTKAVEATTQARVAGGLVNRPRTPQRVLERRQAMLQKRKQPRVRKPPAVVGPPSIPATPTPPAAPAWRSEYDEAMARQPAVAQGMDATDARTGHPTAASYAQEKWVREVGEVVDREVMRRRDVLLAERLAAGEAPDVVAMRARFAQLDAEWDDLWEQSDISKQSQKLFGKKFSALTEAEKDVLHAESAKVHVRFQAIADERASLQIALKKADSGDVLAYRDAFEEVLAEIRPMGVGEAGAFRYVDDVQMVGARGRVTSGAGKVEARKTLDFTSRFFPQSWLDRINGNPPGEGMRYIRTGVIKRGHQSDYRQYAEVMLSRGSEAGAVLKAGDPAMMRVAVHELGHLMETSHARIRALEHALHFRRTQTGTYREVIDQVTGEKVLIPEMEPVRTIPGYKASEKGRQDKFSNPYQGKTYSETGFGSINYWEHFSTGMEGVTTGRYDMLTADQADYRYWVLGILAGL